MISITCIHSIGKTFLSGNWRSFLNKAYFKNIFGLLFKINLVIETFNSMAILYYGIQQNLFFAIVTTNKIVITM